MPSSTADASLGGAVAAAPAGAIAASALVEVLAGPAASVVASAPTASSTAAPANIPCPPEMALVQRTCVDRHEAHLVVPNGPGTFAIHPHHQRPPSEALYEARSAPEVFPQAYLSRKEAEVACKAARKRLCTYDEWRRACRGRAGHLYPYGAKGIRGACNSGKPHLLPQLFGGNARVWKYDEHFNSPLLNQKDGYLARTGSHPECASDEDVHDLVGNLHEWVSGTVTRDFVERLEQHKVERRKQPWRVGNAIFVGGFYSTNSEHGPGCTNVTIAHEPRYHDYSTGFRCCMAATLPPVDPPKRKTKRR
ncbi:MAG: SUMF1/EgtB/PvdO family nonheme iron enzyme [Deltaproteobacteria bacterium]|nr:SUMF1/EgtB/PvdO family nonheme iron enzyme [Deltaproteobacteria bacterium]